MYGACILLLSARDHTLDRLDLALVGVRRVLQLPAYRGRLLGRLGAELSLSTLSVVRAVERCDDGPPSIGDVADLLGITPSTASRAVDDAVAGGFVTREPCHDDGRRQRLRMTAAGIALLDQATSVRRAIIAEVTADWDGDDLHHLVDRLDALLADFARLEEDR